jgi:hypothetical protein
LSEGHHLRLTPHLVALALGALVGSAVLRAFAHTVSYDSTSCPVGTYTLQASAYDARTGRSYPALPVTFTRDAFAGRAVDVVWPALPYAGTYVVTGTATSATRTFTIQAQTITDTTDPPLPPAGSQHRQPTLTAPAPGAIITTGIFEADVATADQTAVGVSVKLTHGDPSAVLGQYPAARSAIDPLKWVVPQIYVNQFGDGGYVLFATAVDGAGAVVTSTGVRITLKLGGTPTPRLGLPGKLSP